MPSSIPLSARLRQIKLLQAAAAQGHSVMCVRMGQVCGPQATGAWSMSEWIPMMLKSSITLGSLPRLSGVSFLLTSSGVQLI